MEKTISFFNRGLEIFLGVLLLVMVFVVFLQIVMRGLVSYSFSWTEELARYLMIWITFLGGAVAFEKGAHIGVDMLVERIPGVLRKIAKVLVFLGSLAFFLIMIVKGVEIVQLAMRQKSPAMRVPMGFVYTAIPLSGLFMMINLLHRFTADFRKG